MKKLFLISCLLLSVLFLSSCSQRSLIEETEPDKVQTETNGLEELNKEKIRNDRGASSSNTKEYAFEENEYSYASIEENIHTDKFAIRFDSIELNRMVADYGKTYKLEVHYPVIMGLDPDREANVLLKTIAFEFMDGNEYSEKIERVLREFSNEEEFRESYVDSKVLYLDDHLISVIYYEFHYLGGASPWIDHYMATIDLEKNQYVKLDEYVSTEQIIDSIRRKDYDIFRGSYNEIKNDPYNEKLIEEFINSVSEIKDVKNGKYTNGSTKYNFGLDNESVYVYFRSEHSLDGCIILEIPFESIKRSFDAH